MKDKIPNPGSDAAIKIGCSCPVLDNNHGAGINIGTLKGRAFWHNADCGLHGSDESKRKYQADREHAPSDIVMPGDAALRLDRPFWEWAWREAGKAMDGGDDAHYMVQCLCLLAGFK